jgi:hypothetical protein
VSNSISSEILSEIIMNNKKTPDLLRVQAQRKICHKITDRLLEWTKKLSLAEGLECRQRLKVVCAVLIQCHELQEVLKSLPQPSSRPICEYAFNAVVFFIEKFDIPGHSRQGYVPFQRHYEEACLYMLRSVFVPSIEVCNFKGIGSEFMQGLLSQSLQENSSITRLILPNNPSSLVSRSVFSDLHRLTALQEIIWQCSCTTDVVIELAKHCRLLKTLDVTASVSVTDDCVEYLLSMTRLETLHVANTTISETRYALILSSLPRVQNITWSGPVDRLLQNIKKACLPKVSTFWGTVSDPSLLTKLCPRIKHLILTLDNENSSELRRLTEVVTLEFTFSNYTTNNLGIVIENMGIRLTKLTMLAVVNINIIEVVTCCPVLKTLILKDCQVITSENFSFAPELPHFMSMKEVTLLRSRDFKNVHKYLQLCVHLEVLRAQCVTELDDATVSEILCAGGFRQLSIILLAFCGHLTLETAMLLLGKCDNLSVLGNLNNWCGLSDDDKMALFACVKNNNLALSIQLE